jgi:hypothetical protein
LTELDTEELTDRFCVAVMERPVWGFHESYPLWFFGEPKIIVPEVCTKISVLYDSDGRVLPLHSTIAVRVRTLADAKRVAAVLQSDGSWRWLRAQCPKMVNGAIRLTVPVLRKLFVRDTKNAA